MAKLKSWIILLAGILIVPAQAPASSGKEAAINWSTYEEARMGDNHSRKYFIYFFTEQCGYCRMLEARTFTDESVIDYINSNYTPVRVNAGKEFKVASRFGIQGVPDLRFLSPEGEGIARWPGFIESSRLLILLRYISTDSYKNMNFNDFAKNQQKE